MKILFGKVKIKIYLCCFIKKEKNVSFQETENRLNFNLYIEGFLISNFYIYMIKIL